MSIRRLHPLPEAVALAARRLKQCESAIALLDRVRPLNLSAERARLVGACLSGQRPRPCFEYAARATLSEVRRVLHETQGALDCGETEQRLLAERADELLLEARLAEQVDTAQFPVLAAQRFPVPQPSEPLRELAAQFLAWQGLPNASAPRHFSDDVADPLSLWSLTSRLLSEQGLAVRIELTDGLVSLAAVADGVVRVRRGALLTEAVARRIALHEVEGHVRPRMYGQQLDGIFMVGSAGASEDEEGRAILLEERAGLLDRERRRELAWRYLAAASVRHGAGFWEVVQLLRDAHAGVEQAVELACRVQRGGGLGRELVYLSAYCRVASAFTDRPELEAVLRSGRVSLRAAAALLAGSVKLHDDRNVV